MAARKSTPRKAARGRRAAARKTRKPAPKRVAKRRAASPKRRTGAKKAVPRRAKVKAASARRAPIRRTPKTARKAKPARAKSSGPKPKPATAPTKAMSARPTPVSGPPSTLGRKRSTPPLARGLHPKLERDRRILPDEDRLDLSNAPDDRLIASARSGHDDLRTQLQRHHESGPELTAGDVDANWADAYAVGDEAPGGDNPTPDQDRVDDIGRALGIQYADGEELKGSDKIAERDRHRWELDPASSEDWPHKPEKPD